MTPTLTRMAPTLAALLGVDAPALSDGPPLQPVLDVAAAAGVSTVCRALVYCPDAVGAHLSDRYPDDFARLRASASVSVALHAVMPSITPVCFASLFTGGPPEAHGIRRYEKPVLRCDTLFDAALRGGLRVAIVAVSGSSISKIFLGRDLDYYEEDYDDEVLARAAALVQADQHHLIVAYVQAYDDSLHATTPFSPRAEAAFRANLAGWDALVDVADRAWAAHAHALVFAPDHGGHLDPETGRGDHGLDLPEDLRIQHYVRVRAGR